MVTTTGPHDCSLDPELAELADSAALAPCIIRATFRHALARICVDPEVYYLWLSTALLLDGCALVRRIAGTPVCQTQDQQRHVKGYAMLEGAVRPPARLTADQRAKLAAASNGFVGGRSVGAVS